MKSMMEVIADVLRGLEVDWKAGSFKILSKDVGDNGGLLQWRSTGGAEDGKIYNAVISA